MTRSLPFRPDLRRLRDEARARQRSGEFDTLARAQYALAMEFGFASWPRLQAYVRTRALDLGGRAEALVRSACSADLRTARTLLDAEPTLGRYDLAAACVTGEAEEVRARLRRDPDAATRAVGALQSPPLAYACFTRFSRAEPQRAQGIRDIVRTLLDAGADPDAGLPPHDEHPQTPLYGAAGIAGDPRLTAMLLTAGADPNDLGANEALYHAAEWPDPECARLILAAGPDPATVTYDLQRVLDFDNLAMLRVFLEHGADPNAGEPSAYRKAVRLGLRAQAELLREFGGDDATLSEADRALGAVLAGEVAPTGRPHPHLLGRAVRVGRAELVRALLAAGADPDRGDRTGETPLTVASWFGRADIVELLLSAGASGIDGALGAALHGSENCHDPRGGSTMRRADEVNHGAYAEVVRLLLAAGARTPETLSGSDQVRRVLVEAGTVDE